MSIAKKLHFRIAELENGPIPTGGLDPNGPTLKNSGIRPNSGPNSSETETKTSYTMTK